MLHNINDHACSPEKQRESDQSHPPMQHYSDASANRYLDEKHLAKRWNMSIRTLQQWRYLSKGLQYCRFGSRIRYSIEEIEKYEKEHLFSNTTQY